MQVYKTKLKLVFIMFCFSGLFFIMNTASGVEINNPLAPISPPSIAPLPQPNYKAMQLNKNYSPKQQILKEPTFDLDIGPDINHQQSCATRYKNYRSRDDSYLDPNGVRQKCRSAFPR